MKAWLFTPSMKPILPRSVVAIGVFDGVHLAHRELLGLARAEAQKRSLPLCVFTFSSECPTQKTAPPLYDTAEKMRLLEACGCDGVLYAPFSAVSSLSAEDFVKTVLVQTLGCSLAVCGYNFRFGAGASGNAETLGERMRTYGGNSLTVPPFLWQGTPLSTTRIREMLTKGAMENANTALGECYHLTGTVERGLQFGGKIGMPTLNVSVPDGIFTPKIGVYAAHCEIDGKRYPALVNYGTCPTFGARTPHAEAHLLEPIAESYGKNVKLSLLSYLREEKTFASAGELLRQIETDINKARSIL